MSNNYFQFKKFRIVQDKCAMKVTTDACIQGAWTPLEPGVKQVLDIGAGTGLLSMMLAQRNEFLQIDAIELDASSTIQAAENVSNSLFKSRIHIINDDVRTHMFSKKYDLIIVNPPFFNNSLLGIRVQENAAKHTLSLSYAALLRVITENIAPNGYVSILLPIEESKIWIALCKAIGWHENKRLLIQHKANAPVKRIVSIMEPFESATHEETLIIKNADDTYTEKFRELLQDFYLEF